jgi:hypothetical protein
VAAVLALPERRQQIIQVTVRIALCLDAESRAFLSDCQAGLIEGGLEYMRQRRHDLLASVQQDSPEAIVIVDSSEDQLLEQVGMALDALRLAEIIRQVFPDVREKYEPFETARAILADETQMREIMIHAVRAHGAGNSALYEEKRKEILPRLEAARPAWRPSCPALKEVCGEADRERAGLLFGVIAVDDMRASLVLELLTNARSEALEYLTRVSRRIDALHELESRDSKS